MIRGDFSILFNLFTNQSIFSHLSLIYPPSWDWYEYLPLFIASNFSLCSHLSIPFYVLICQIPSLFWYVKFLLCSNLSISFFVFIGNSFFVHVWRSSPLCLSVNSCFVFINRFLHTPFAFVLMRATRLYRSLCWLVGWFEIHAHSLCFCFFRCILASL